MVGVGGTIETLVVYKFHQFSDLTAVTHVHTNTHTHTHMLLSFTNLSHKWLRSGYSCIYNAPHFFPDPVKIVSSYQPPKFVAKNIPANAQLLQLSSNSQDTQANR